jgi:hypothetical protein
MQEQAENWQKAAEYFERCDCCRRCRREVQLPKHMTVA